MSGRVGSITTDIIADGLVLNIDAANRASYVEFADKTYNTLDLSVSGSLVNDPSGSLGSPKAWDFDGVDGWIGYDATLPGAITFSTIAKSSNSTWNDYAGLGSHRAANGFIFHNNPSATTVSFYIYNSSTTFLSLGTITPSNIENFNFYTLSSNGSNLHKVYLNGELKITNTTTHNRNMSGINQNVNLGLDTGVRYNDIKISNNYFYNTQLSDSEVLHNYNALKGRFGL